MNLTSKKRNLLILFSIVLLNICSCSEQENKNDEIIRPVYVSDVINKTVPIYVNAFGYLTAENNIDIKSQVTGKILSCSFKQGQEVKKGDLLFTIDPRVYEAQLKQAQADLKQDLADLKYQKYIVQHDQKLQLHGAISSQDYIQFLTNLQKTNAKIQSAEASVDDYKINVEYCKIKSPIDGITGVRQVDPGNIVTANTGPTLVNIKSINPLYLDFTIPEDNFLRLQNAMKKSKLKVLVFVDEFGIANTIAGKMYTGYLKFFDNSIDNETGTIFLRAVIPNQNKELWPGQFVRLFLVLDEIENATLVPYESVGQGLKGDYIFLVDKDNKARLKYVKVGQKEGDYIVINSKNVKPGEKVVTVGQMGLAPGVKVKILEEQKFNTPDFTREKKAKPSKVIKSTDKIQKDKIINKDVLKSRKIPRNITSELKKNADQK